ncbi:MAG: 1-deoxy-D-xylulose-5-phosphate synthase [Ruminococcaceae bacterium]|nr:1-deoxy-D-xylulose-5-phosphate synthase [Oscillospiraceae bacterium]
MSKVKESMEREFPLLEGISSPDDLKALPTEQLPALAEEIRQFLIHRVRENGGHLASNLGVVEMTVAIHRVFSSPDDHIIFDVGHQSYVHKLLTGRKDQFDTLRQAGGLSGFPKREESEHDAFGTGHSSTSLSASLGFSEADKLCGSDAYTVCVFGDGAYTGGMIHEALNNSRKNLRLIIILNENEMSISKNIGRFAKTLSKLRTSGGYFKTKSVTASFLQKLPLIGKPLFSLLLRIKMSLKASLYGSNYFENLGLYYLGPADGNDEQVVEKLLREAKKSGQSCVVHLKTKKGKGYAPAEATPDKFHGMSPAASTATGVNSFSSEMGSVLCDMARKNQRICAITAAMTDGTGLSQFRSAYPERFFDVGIAEAHAVTFAAGLAANGMRPVVALYSTFLQRAYDNVIHDVALQDLPVVLCVDRAGLNAWDGPTHHGTFDVAFLSQIPNLEIYTPITRVALRNAMYHALHSSHPAAIRYPNGCEDPLIVKAFYKDGDVRDVGVRNDFLNTPSDSPEDVDGILITHGRIVKEALFAKEALRERGFSLGILLLEQLKPYEKIAKEILPLLPAKPCKIVFLEEEIRAGGMGMLLSDALLRYEVMKNKSVSILGLEDAFAVPTADASALSLAGLDAGGIVKALLS